MRPLLRAAATAALVTLCLPAPAGARPDGPLDAYLEHVAEQSELSLRWPANGTLTDEFGPRWGRLHAGLDIGILRSLEVTAAASGRVTQTGYLTGYEGYGNVVIVDVGDGYSTMYAHLSRIDVRRGEWVPAGEPVGLAGCTGSCTGTHLHFELHERGRPVDPLPKFENRR